jgi:hypothetical protein
VLAVLAACGRQLGRKHGDVEEACCVECEARDRVVGRFGPGREVTHIATGRCGESSLSIAVRLCSTRWRESTRQRHVWRAGVLARRPSMTRAAKTLASLLFLFTSRFGRSLHRE